jgi:hypothetical protein
MHLQSMQRPTLQVTADAYFAVFEWLLAGACKAATGPAMSTGVHVIAYPLIHEPCSLHMSCDPD